MQLRSQLTHGDGFPIDRAASSPAPSPAPGVKEMAPVLHSPLLFGSPGFFIGNLGEKVSFVIRIAAKRCFLLNPEGAVTCPEVQSEPDVPCPRTGLPQGVLLRLQIEPRNFKGKAASGHSKCILPAQSQLAPEHFKDSSWTRRQGRGAPCLCARWLANLRAEGGGSQREAPRVGKPVSQPKVQQWQRPRGSVEEETF